jgi:hypothetical protein
MTWFTRSIESPTIPRQSPSHTQVTEQRLVENTKELGEAVCALTVASEFLKSEISRLLLDREHKRARFADLQAENARLKQALGMCK